MTAMKPKGLLDEMIALVRTDPDRTLVTWKFNNDGPWQTSTGKEFLELWEQPVAGTIDVARVVGLGRGSGETAGGPHYGPCA